MNFLTPITDTIRRAALSATLIIALAFTARSQHGWEHIGPDDGLAQSYVSTVMQDSRGFLWFGTMHGLSRYDGYTFRNYYNEPSDSLTISPGLINALHECPSGVIWVGFMDGQIDLFDRRTEQFFHLPRTPKSAEERGTLLDIVEDPGGGHWCSTTGGVLHVEPASADGQGGNNSFVPSAVGLLSFSSVAKRNYTTLTKDGSGGVWMLSGKSLRRLDRPDPLVDLTPGGFKGSLRIDGLAEGADGTFRFLAFDETGIWRCRIDAKSSTMTRDLVDASMRYGDPPSFCFPDTTGMVWYIRWGDLMGVDPEGKRPSRHISAPYVSFRSLWIDDGGNFWCGTTGWGVYKYIPSEERFGLRTDSTFYDLAQRAVRERGFPPRREIADPVVSDLYSFSVSRDREGRYWYLGWYFPHTYNTDLYVHDPRTGKTDTYRRLSYDVPWTTGTIPPSQQLTHLEDESGRQWFIGPTAIFTVDPRTRRVDRYTAGENALRPFAPADFSESDHQYQTALKDPDGSFWFSDYPDGLCRLDPITRSVTRLRHSAADSVSISSDRVLSLLNDPVEPGRFLWVGTEGGGLNRMEKATGNATRITTRDGLPSNVIYSIHPDPDGNLWMSTNQGICRYGPASGEFRYYDMEDGLQGMEFNRYSSFQSASGRIYMGGTSGFNVFMPAEIVQNPHRPKVVFTDLRINGSSVSWTDPESPLHGEISEAKHIRLPYEKNTLTLEFAALDFTNTGRNQYSYLLEGYADEWTKPSTQRTATFTNLPPGEYTLRVRGSNNDGIWDPEGSTILIAVLPPWYRTWWSYTLYAVIAVGALVVFRKYDLKRIRLKDQLDLEVSRAEQLKEVDKLKMQFFQNISHEFRTPLTLILGPIEKLLPAFPAGDPRSRDLRFMRRNARRLLRLINQLLDISKIEAGGVRLRARKQDIVGFLRGLTMSFQSLAERKDIFLDIETGLTRLELWFDEDKLEKVIINLLSNAFKFTPDHGEVVVTVSLVSVPPVPVRAGGVAEWVAIAVRDTGIGILPEKIPHVFDRFYQVDSASTRMHEGTGIGLALVKDLVNLHHGAVTVASEPAKGSVFTVYLPVGDAHLGPDEILTQGADGTEGASSWADERREDTAAEIAVAESDDGEEGTPARSPDRQGEGTERPVLLVVEDNRDVRAYVRSHLEPVYTVIEATDGEAGVRTAREAVPDLVISDVMMPKMDGYEVCRRIKADEMTSHIPVILLTAKAAREDRIGGLETGADDYLIKPFDSSELLVRVRNLIENRRRLREKFGRELVSLRPGEIAVAPAEKEFLRKVLEAVEARIGDEGFGVGELAVTVGVSPRQLHRKLKGLADTTPVDFIRTCRLHRAMELLRKDSTTISEIAYSVGFGSPAYFTKCFQEQFGQTPTDVRKTAS